MKVHTVLSACILLTFFAHFGQCCDPAEIGQVYTITSTANVAPEITVRWQLGNSLITIYDSSLPTPNTYPDSYVGTKNSLTILSVSKKDGSEVFQHSFSWTVAYSCELDVYKRASTPTCETVTLTDNQIRTTCSTAQVYPQAKCQFTLQNEETDRRDVKDGTPYIRYTHTDPKPDENEFYSTSCTLQYPVDGLKPGNWRVQVSMYPDLTGVSLDQGTTVQVANRLYLSIPTVNIDSNNCPKGIDGEGDRNVRNGYIRQGHQAICECTLTQAGNPSGALEWSSTQARNIADLGVATTVRISSPGNFTCRSTSVLDGSHSETYIPEYAYGPKSASLTFQPAGPIFLCPNQQSNVDITCQVPANSFSPATLFTIRDDTSNNLVTKIAGDTARSNSVNYNFTKSGQHTFTCRVENAIFSDMISEAPAGAIQVYAPPNNPPILKVTGDFVIKDNSGTWVKQGSDITVSCDVGEAYPLVNSVSVTCGQKTSSSGKLSVNGVNSSAQSCQCTVDHETKTPCDGFNLNKEMTIQLAYGPIEVTVSSVDDHHKEVPNEPLNLCRYEGLDLTVMCAVKQSDVQPGLTNGSFILSKPGTIFITQQSYLGLNTSTSRVYRSITKLRITTGGNHTLICEAKNTIFSEIEQTQSMTLYVREPPKDPPVISAHSVQYGDILVDGDNVTVTCEASGGHPSVQSVTLTCSQNKSVTSNGTSIQLTLNNIGLEYNETNCTCQATHVTGCYDLMGVLPLTVIMSNQTLSEQEETSPIGAAVGGAIGAFVVVAVIVGGIFFIRRRMKKKEHRSADVEVYTENIVYGTAVQDYTAIKTTIESATAPPKNYSRESPPVEKEDNPYENVKLDRKSLVRTSSKTTPALAAKPKYPGTSVETKAVQKSSKKDQNNPSGETEYTTVDKTKTEHSQNSDHDQIADITSAGASGEIPEIPDRHYNPEEIKDSIKEPSTSKPSKGKKKNIKEKTAKKEKETKDKKEKKKKGKNKDEHHVYSNKAFDQSGDGEVYANIGTSLKSSTDVDDGMN